MRTIVIEEVPGYNGRRYGRPWAAKISFEGPKALYDFSVGDYLGDQRGGELFATCSPGDIIAAGQKDGRGNQSRNVWYIIGEDYGLTEVKKQDALKHWLAQQ